MARHPKFPQQMPERTISAVHFSSETAEWTTPLEFMATLRTNFPFALDAAATAKNAKAALFYDKKIDALSLPVGCWVKTAGEQSGHVFCNPPYGRAINKWCERFYLESLKAKRVRVVALLPARTDTKYFHEFCVKGDVYFLKSRLHFNEAAAGAPFPSMVVVFNPPNLIDREPHMKTWDWKTEPLLLQALTERL